jgi:tetratricopeptide (TPR) repeat protein
VQNKIFTPMHADGLQVIGFSRREDFQISPSETPAGHSIALIKGNYTHEDFTRLVTGATGEEVILVDLDRLHPSALARLVCEHKKKTREDGIHYLAKGAKKWFGFIDPRLYRGDREIFDSPVLIGNKDTFLRAYGGKEVDENLLRAVAYSLSKSHVRFYREESTLTWEKGECAPTAWNYVVKAPLRFLLSGAFFRTFFRPGDPRREMTTRFLMLLFGLFVLFYMPYISKDYGISGDEYVDHRHAMLVLDYFTKGDEAALNQPKTMLHFYGNVVQVVAAVVTETIEADDVYRVRHFICALTGAAGIIFIGLLGLRLGGGACGLLAMLLLFLSPRYLGHSMNNLKDIPFAVGYLISIFYFIRLFDRYPIVKLRHVIGAVAGIVLALGTRSGGLILFPYLLMYGGLFYILWVGWKEFYKFVKHWKEIENILLLIILVLGLGYLLSILCWPYALARPFGNVVASLREFTNLSIGLRTIFEGQQVMSNMLPWHYAPKYLFIASPLVVLIGWIGYMIHAAVRRKQFTLNAFFLLFALIFPVFWVIHKNSNLYGGIRHMLFVMPVMVVLAAYFWTRLLAVSSRTVRVISLMVLAALIVLPLKHVARNHPNDYIYFNELIGGLHGAYGDYETDYYYNSLKEAVDWFKENVDYRDRPVTIITNHSANVQHYFRKDTNVKVIYGRYYEKFDKDWDYMIFANVYISSYQLKNGLFPVREGLLHAVEAGGLPMSFVGQRVSKQELEAMRLLGAEDYAGAVHVLEEYLEKYPWNEEMWMRLSRVYYGLGQPANAARTAGEALKLQPQLTDALSVKALSELEQGNTREAHAAVDQMLAQNDMSSSSYYMKGLVYSKEYKDKEAIAQLNNALRYNPGNNQALVLAGNILRRNGNHAQAIKPFEAAVQQGRADEDAFLALADCYLWAGMNDKYQQVLTVLERDGKNRHALAKLKIRALLLQQKTDEAEVLLASTFGSEDDPEWLTLLAMRDIQRNHPGDARERVEQALQLNPREIDALKLRATLSSVTRDK